MGERDLDSILQDLYAFGADLGAPATAPPGQLSPAQPGPSSDGAHSEDVQVGTAPITATRFQSVVTLQSASGTVTGGDGDGDEGEQDALSMLRRVKVCTAVLSAHRSCECLRGDRYR